MIHDSFRACVFCKKLLDSQCMVKSGKVNFLLPGMTVVRDSTRANHGEVLGFNALLKRWGLGSGFNAFLKRGGLEKPQFLIVIYFL